MRLIFETNKLKFIKENINNGKSKIQSCSWCAVKERETKQTIDSLNRSFLTFFNLQITKKLKISGMAITK